MWLFNAIACLGQVFGRRTGAFPGTGQDCFSRASDMNIAITASSGADEQIELGRRHSAISRTISAGSSLSSNFLRVDSL